MKKIVGNSFFVMAAVVCGLILSGCEAEKAECESDQDCTNEFLPRCNTETGECVECLADEDCGTGMECNLEKNTCEEIIPPECESDNDCQDPSLPVCNTETGKCVQCLTDEDCGDDMYCDLDTNTCVSEPQECSTDEDCSDMICPEMVGMDTPKCNPLTGTCYCGGECGDGFCDEYEEMSDLCPADCGGAQCYGVGERYEDFENLCCEGLVPMLDCLISQDNSCVCPLCPCNICLVCGDGYCVGEEHHCNCPEDCP